MVRVVGEDADVSGTLDPGPLRHATRQQTKCIYITTCIIHVLLETLTAVGFFLQQIRITHHPDKVRLPPVY